MEGQFSYNSELPGGRAPFWIKDEALTGLGLRPGDAVSVDSGEAPRDGDLVLVELEAEDGASERTVRRHFAAGADLILRSANPAYPELRVPAERAFVVGVVRTRVRFEAADDERTRIVEEPLG